MNEVKLFNFLCGLLLEVSPRLQICIACKV